MPLKFPNVQTILGCLYKKSELNFSPAETLFKELLFEHQKHIFKLNGKEIITILGSKMSLFVTECLVKLSTKECIHIKLHIILGSGTPPSSEVIVAKFIDYPRQYCLNV